jgi:hypothetical protein
LGRPPPFADCTQVANVSWKCGTSQKLKRKGPTSGVVDTSYSSSVKAFSIRSSLPQAPATRRNTSRAPGGAIRRGRAGVAVPGQRSTGTGCWRGA